MRALRSTGALRRPARRTVAADADTVWLFDLDNTLHDCSKAIFKAIDSAMGNAVATTLNIDADTANVLRKTYWKRYGATVIGMVRHHGADANTFLELSHAFDVPPLVHSEAGLAYKFGRLPGRKVLLTNAPLKYAREVLKTLGILHHFECVWAIDHMTLQGQMRPKPSLALMKQVLVRLRAPAHRVILVEDTLKNLRSARAVGMRTVHIFHPGTPFSAMHGGRCHYVDVKINSVGKLFAGHRQLRTRGKMGPA